MRRPGADSGLVLLAWLPWVGIIVVAGIVGGTLGLTGVLGHPTTTRTVVTVDASVARTANAFDCPAGSVVDTLTAGDRVLALQRSSDSAYLEVRDPLNLLRVIWLRARDLSVDPEQHDIATLPIGTCPSVEGILMPPTNHVLKAGPAPTKPTPQDTTPPSLGTPTANRDTTNNPVCLNEPFDATREYAIISVTATDNKGVTGVSISWTGPGTDHGSAGMTRSGATWSYKYDPASNAPSGMVTFTLQARDAAGNRSGKKTITILRAGCVD